jgi:geranylgeranyl reductase family protein
MGGTTRTALEADVLVVGAGPGGSAAAYHLASQGHDVLLVDKTTFPREKVCGDGLTPRGTRAVQRMGLDLTEPGFTRIEALRCYGTRGAVLDLPWPATRSFPAIGAVRTRFDFDHLLLQRAEKVGVRVLQGTEVVGPTLDAGWVTGAELEGEHGRQTVRARHVIAADGASSRFGQKAGVKRMPDRPVAAAARRYYRSPRPHEPVIESFLTLWDGSGLLAGYGWVFPVGDGVFNVGVGILKSKRHSEEVSARRVMDSFVASLPPEWEMGEESATSPLLSGPIPMGINRDPLAVPGLVLVGDAAGVTNPFNGEGIAYAMETGELAAEVIGDALDRNRSALVSRYPSLVRERYAKYFLLGRNWMRMLGNPAFMRFAVDHGLSRRRLMTFALRVMTGITDGPDGGTDDRVLAAMLALAPER